MLTALSIHREIYTTPRSYALWLLFNPLDFALFLGLPVAVAGLLFLAGTSRHVAAGGAGRPIIRFRLVTFAAVAALLALGVTRGEVGRLWIPLMPLVLVASLGAGSAPGRKESLVHATLLAAFTLVMGSYWVI
jgi:tetrahydromethanopterin S-methyltransferase subunit C